MVIRASLFLCSSKFLTSSKKSYVLRTRKKDEKQLIRESDITYYFETILGRRDLMTNLAWDLKCYLRPQHKMLMIQYAWSYTFKTLSFKSHFVNYMRPQTLLLGLNLGCYILVISSLSQSSFSFHFDMEGIYSSYYSSKVSSTFDSSA